jgi:crossover junction endodeoxyribonuclease RuvC
MIIFGIDPGTNRTGWGVITKKARKNEELHIQYVGHGCIVTEKINTMPERLLLLHTNLNELVKKHKPNCLIVENIFFGRNVKTAISVSQARGVIMLTAALFDLPVFEYTPSTVKLSLTGSGKTEKKGVQETVRTILNLDETTLAFNGKKSKDFDDSADALAIALHHAMKIV